MLAAAWPQRREGWSCRIEVLAVRCVYKLQILEVGQRLWACRRSGACIEQLRISYT